MKCAFSKCQKIRPLPLRLFDDSRGKDDFFCGHAHLLAWLLQMAGNSAQSAVNQALSAAQTPEGRKALVSYLVDKVL